MKKNDKIFIVRANDYECDYEHTTIFYYNKKSAADLIKYVIREEVNGAFDCAFAHSESEANDMEDSSVMYSTTDFSVEELMNMKYGNLWITDGDARNIHIYVSIMHGFTSSGRAMEI